MTYSKNFMLWVKEKNIQLNEALENSANLNWATDGRKKIAITNTLTGKHATAHCKKGELFNEEIGLAIAWAKYLGEKIPSMKAPIYTVIDHKGYSYNYFDKDDAISMFIKCCLRMTFDYDIYMVIGQLKTTADFLKCEDRETAVFLGNEGIVSLKEKE